MPAYVRLTHAGDRADVVSGTLDAAEAGSPITAERVAIEAVFAGTATVRIQRQLDDSNWRDITDLEGNVYEFTASFNLDYVSAGVPVRLNCTDYTDDVTYVMRPF